MMQNWSHVLLRFVSHFFVYSPLRPLAFLFRLTHSYGSRWGLECLNPVGVMWYFRGPSWECVKAGISSVTWLKHVEADKATEHTAAKTQKGNSALPGKVFVFANAVPT